MLQQSPTFGPFRREFLAFAQIAERARENDVTDIVGATATNWNDVFNVVRCHLLVAVVAPPLLPLILCLYLLRSITSTCRMLAGAPAMLTSNMTIFPTLGLLVTYPACSDRFSMFFFVRLRLSKQPTPIRLMITCVVRLSRGISMIALDDAFSVFLVILFVASRVSISPVFMLSISTLLAMRTESTFRASLVEEFKSSGEPLQALRTLLLRKGRGIIHGLNSPLFSHLSFLVARMVGVPLLSQWLITPLLGNTSSIPFFIAA